MNFLRLMKLNVLFVCVFSVVAMACADDDPDPVVQETDSIAGKYVGGWTSDPPTPNEYKSIPISVILTQAEEASHYEGEFFFSGSFTPCCGGADNNGTVGFVIEGNEISSFVYNDKIPGCPGLFKGTGTVESDGRLLISFTGSDCEGEHEGGQLFLRKEKSP